MPHHPFLVRGGAPAPIRRPINHDQMRKEKPMTASETRDITYPGATAGVETIQTGDVAASIEQLVAHVGGTMETTRTVRPTNMGCDYVLVAQD